MTIPITADNTIPAPRGWALYRDGLVYTEGGRKPKEGRAPLAPSLDVDAPAGAGARVCPWPVWVERVAVHIPRGHRYLEVVARPPNGTELRRWVEYEVATQRSRVVGLARFGIPVGSENAPGLARYFLEAVADLSPPICYAVSGTTYVETPDGRAGWVLGGEWIGPPGPDVVVPESERTSINDALCARGDPREWWQRCAELQRVPGIGPWLLAASLASPLLRLLDQRSVVVYHYGTTSKGKTAFAHFGATIFGHGPKSSVSFNSTPIAREAVLYGRSDITTVFDERQVAGRDDEDFTTTVHRWVDGVPRLRSGTDGRLQERLSEGWVTIIRATGEAPLLESGNSGAINRTLQVEGAVFADDNHARDLNQWLTRSPSYGHCGRAFLRSLVPAANEPAARAALRERVASLEAAILQRAPSTWRNDARRTHLATIAYAEAWMLAELSRVVGEFEPDVEDLAEYDARAIDHALLAIDLMDKDVAGKVNKVDHILDVLREHVASASINYADLRSKMGRVAAKNARAVREVGVILDRPNALVVEYLPGELAKVLRERKIDPSTAIKDLDRAGYLETTPSQPTRVKGHRGVYVWRIRLDGKVEVDDESESG